ncbi:sugar O-acetyltransferase [Cognataquiflexum rubidum]|uniref:sugar O-acetyltransferase n=1 Tax=Cognataquiflexum rubidum TaxID=2922273 RepID=UPI001F136BE4|nr:sugar O-acetyltransferase [Cognataquiflexum rubidum]MCH6233260.1 sugar O-acetyltransferase [Cognataquiflexum rubidum]
MTEREKLLAGEFYNSRDPELLEMYHQAKELLKQWSDESSRNGEEKSRILQKLLGKVGKGVWIEAPFYCDYGKNITIGENTFINANAVFLDCNRIDIGKNVLIGPNVQIYTATHPISASDRINPNPESNQAPYKTKALPVRIGDNCWIGGNTVILPGITIGNNVTVAAGSLVTKDIPNKKLAMGSPARLVRDLER